jgi:hypothetical protein
MCDDDWETNTDDSTFMKAVSFFWEEAPLEDIIILLIIIQLPL